MTLLTRKHPSRSSEQPGGGTVGWAMYPVLGEPEVRRCQGTLGTCGSPTLKI